MTSPHDEPSNPYQAPDFVATEDVLRPSTPEDRDLLRNYQSETTTLGSLWMALGFFGVIAGLVLAARISGLPEEAREEATLRAIVVGGAALLYFVMGALMWQKRLWPVYVGLAFGYLSLLQNLSRPNVCSILFMLAIVALGHRVLSSANKLRGLGVPLGEDPNSLHYARVPLE